MMIPLNKCKLIDKYLFYYEDHLDAKLIQEMHIFKDAFKGGVLGPTNCDGEGGQWERELARRGTTWEHGYRVHQKGVACDGLAIN
ncbi:hypothetical protein L6452_21647 [Arctium lappa]|uniref:Uncharacterized protein n=1 Tax=Arctium lappa TaxID=4217 RepID=A0ACB9AXZ3_ARCLA|nr:hypothetical protein L6452_21647 [Arctium lappa]